MTKLNYDGLVIHTTGKDRFLFVKLQGDKDEYLCTNLTIENKLGMTYTSEYEGKDIQDRIDEGEWYVDYNIKEIAREVHIHD